jgi:hypothetical protein
MKSSSGTEIRCLKGRSHLEDQLKVEIKEIGCRGVSWIKLVQKWQISCSAERLPAFKEGLCSVELISIVTAKSTVDKANHQ